MDFTLDTTGSVTAISSFAFHSNVVNEFSITLIQQGVSYNITQALCTTIQAPTKQSKYNDVTTLDLGFVDIPSFGLPVPGRGDYIIFNTKTYPNWFTGYVTNDPEPTFIGKGSDGHKQWHYTVLANSDEYILNLQKLPINRVYINTSVGGIIRGLVNELLPGVFDLTNVEDGPLVAKYVLDPTQTFSDIVKDLSSNAFYKFYGVSHALYFASIDSAGVNLTIDGNDPLFNASMLQAKPSTDPVINDVTVFGAVEPQGSMNEYFLGDGYTGEFKLSTGVFGVAEEVLLNEQFTSQGIDPQTWTVYDSIQSYLQVSQGYLNCLGGNATQQFDIFIQTNDPIPLEGNLRITHGQWDFVQQSSGLLGALYVDLPSAPVNGVFSDLLYGVIAIPGTNGTTNLFPVLDGVVDYTQSLNVNNYNLRYTARTLITCSNPLRNPQTYRSFNSDGTTADITFDSLASVVTYSTFIAVVDQNTGAVLTETTFTNRTSLSGSTLYAFYTPLVSDNLYATVTGITVSQPAQATLEEKSLEFPQYKLVGSGGDILFGQNQCFFLGTTTAVNGDGSWSISARLDSLTNQTGTEKAGLLVANQADVQVGSGSGPFVSITLSPNGTLVMRYRLHSGDNAVQLPVLNENNGATDGIVLPQYLRLKNSAGVVTGSYSSDGYSWTDLNVINVSTGTLTNPVPGLVITGSSSGVYEQVMASFRQVLVNTLPASLDVSGSLGYPNTWPVGYYRTTKDWTKQVIGVNELDTLDGQAPDATIVESANSSKKSVNNRSSYQYNPTACTLEYFSDTTTQTTNVPDVRDLVHVAYTRAGASFSRVVDWNSVIAESEAWQTSGFRSKTINNTNPIPRTSDECTALAAATIKSSGWQHYDGSYTAYSRYNLSSDVVAGGIVTFQNFSGDIGNLKQEVIQQVKSVCVAVHPNELFTHDITFGKIDLGQQFLARTEQGQAVALPQDDAYIPPAIDLDAFDSSILPNINQLIYTGQTRDQWNFSWPNDSANRLLPEQFMEVRSSDDSWGCDAGKNIVTRIPYGTPTDFTTQRNANGRSAFARIVDQRNYVTYSEDLTKWGKGTGANVSNIKAVNPEGLLSQLSEITVTQKTALYLAFPFTADQGDLLSTMLWMQGPPGAITYVQAFCLAGPIPSDLSFYGDYSFNTPSVLLGYGLDGYGNAGYGSPDTWQSYGYGVAPYGASPYGGAIPWQLYTANKLNGFLSGGWDFIRADNALVPYNCDYIVLRVLFGTPGTYKATRLSLEKSPLNTVYCRTNGARYGASSRFSAGVKTSLPLIPSAPVGSLDITDPANPVIHVTLPGNLTDVWGYEVRDSDNSTILATAHYGDTGFGLGYDMTVTVANNTLRARSFYLYTFNLLGEYSDAYTLQLNIPKPMVSGFTFDDHYFTCSFHESGQILLNQTLTSNQLTPKNNSLCDNWYKLGQDSIITAVWENPSYSQNGSIGGFLLRVQPNITIPANTVTSVVGVVSDKYAVSPGQTVTWSALTGVFSAGQVPSGLHIYQRLGVQFLDVNYNVLSFAYSSDIDATVALSRYDLVSYGASTAPQGAAYVRLHMAGFVSNVTGVGITLPNAFAADMRFNTPLMGIDGLQSPVFSNKIDIYAERGLVHDVFHGNQTSPFFAMKEVDYLNTRYIVITPSDALGNGYTSVLKHVYTPPPPVECNADEVFTVGNLAGFSQDPIIPVGLPVTYQGSYISEAISNYNKNTTRSL